MNARQLGLIGLAALGLALAAPVHAAPDFMESAFIVVQRDRSDRTDARRHDRRDTRDTRDTRQDDRRDVGREESRGYGYGYERRQQQRYEDDDRQRGRR